MTSQRKGIAVVRFEDSYTDALNLPPGKTNYAWHMDRWETGTNRLPMLRSDRNEDTIPFTALVPEDYDGYALMFNEPTRQGTPGTMTVVNALDLFVETCDQFPYIRWVVGNNRGRHLYAEGGWWLRDFMTGLPNRYRRHVAAWGIHWYVREASITQCVRDLRLLMAESGLARHIWITEMGTDEPGQAGDWMQQAREHHLVDRFFWWQPRNRTDSRSLFTPAGDLTEIGQLYADL